MAGKIEVRKMRSANEWHVWVPPPVVADTDDVEPFGSSFWPSWDEALRFVRFVLATV